MKNEKSIVKFDELDFEVLSTEQELKELYGGANSKKGLVKELLDLLTAGLNGFNCNCSIGNNCSCSGGHK